MLLDNFDGTTELELQFKNFFLLFLVVVLELCFAYSVCDNPN